jgi:hypothetical protein
MTIIFGPVKSAAYHPDVSEAAAAYAACTIDVLEARRRTTRPPHFFINHPLRRGLV